MVAARKAQQVKEALYLWEGKDKSGKIIKGEMRAAGEASVSAHLRRQGITTTKVKKRSGGGKKIKDKDITLFTRQLATMLKSGVPLLQSFDIVSKGHSNPSVSRLLNDIKLDVETGSSLEQSFRKFPLYFDDLYCNLIGAGEAAGILDGILDRLATYKEKILAIKSKIKGALFYPTAVIAVAFIITAVIMIFVVPAFKQLFESFGADLPGPTLVLMQISDFFVKYWWLIFGGLGGGIYAFFYFLKRSKKNAACGGQDDPENPDIRGTDSQSHHRPLDTYPGHHVCSRRAAGGGFRFRGRRSRQHHVLRCNQKDSARGQPGGDADGSHAEYRRCSPAWCCKWSPSARRRVRWTAC